MASDRPFDFELDGHGYLLARAEGRGRAWRRTGQVDSPSRRNVNDTTYGNIADTLDHPEVWNDWSGGAGDAYEDPGRPASYHWARGFDLRFPRQAIHAQAPQLIDAALAGNNGSLHRMNANYFLDIPLGQPAGAGAVLVLGRGYVTAWQPSHLPHTAGSAFVPTTPLTSATINWGDRPALYGSYIYLPALTASTAIRRLDNTAALTATYLTGSPNYSAVHWFAKEGGKLWFAVNRQQIRSILNPATAIPAIDNLVQFGGDANWTATLNIAQFISDGLALEDQLHIGGSDGVYQGNVSGTFTNIANELGAGLDVDNNRDLTSFQGGLAFAQGPHLWWYRPSQGGNSELREVGPSSLFSNRSAVRGKFTAVRGYGKWLYAGLFTGSGSYFMVGRDASYPLPYVWHPLHDFLGLNCKVHRIHVDGITAAGGAATVAIPQRIWAATEPSYGSRVGATAPIFYWPIPRGDNNPVSDVSFSANYLGSARLDLPASEWAAPGTTKVWRVNETWAENLSAAQFADLSYHIDFGARATLGRAQTIPKSTNYFTAGSGNFVQGQALGLSIDSFTASLGVTPVYRAFVTRGALMPGSVDVIEARTRIADNMRSRRGAPMRPGAVMLEELRDRSVGSAPSILTDLTGVRSWVKVQGPVEEEEFYQVGEDAPEVMATVKMSVLTFSGPP